MNFLFLLFVSWAMWTGPKGLLNPVRWDYIMVESPGHSASCGHVLGTLHVKDKADSYEAFVGVKSVGTFTTLKEAQAPVVIACQLGTKAP